MHVIISGGGTGGHIFPAVAIAKTIQKQFPQAKILFVGALGKMEMEKVPAAGFEIVGLPIVGIQRRLTWKNLLVPFKLLASMLKARRIIREFKPDIAIGVGGYASGPLLRAATSAGIATLIQEQNSYPGITNRILSKKVNTICVAYPGLEKYFPYEKLVMTGNPVRPEVVDLQGKAERARTFFKLDSGRKTVLIIGGSLGARTVNKAVEAAAKTWSDKGLQVIWQTGKGYIDQAKTVMQQVAHVQAHEFIREMDLAYAAADVVVSRAGAMSISEVCLVGKPAIFIPSPNVSEDHQTKNAMALVSRGAAVLVKDAEAEAALKDAVLGLIGDDAKLNTLAAGAKAMAFDHAAERIVEEVIKLIPEEKRRTFQP
jgi:UDP-N-acetylglucosamine--N-acetylmuramyl-(pentapeptide) pyrophosphoryl-undecaprenol N-acetylglucosamine transferase